MAAFAPATHLEIHLHLAQSSRDERQQHFVSFTEQKGLKQLTSVIRYCCTSLYWLCWRAPPCGRGL